MFHKHASSLEMMDKEIYGIIQKETNRQETGIELIASENYTSKAVMQAQGSTLTNKYAEGYPGKRYYGGCEHVDVAEDLARERVKKLFSCEYANVQPHSGSQANMAVYFSVLKPGDTIMGMDLSQGGHLTHGSPVNFSGRLYNVVSYGLNKESELLDYDALRDLAAKTKPKMIVGGASAYPRTINFEIMAEIAKEVGAYFFVDMAHIAGLIAAELHPTPVGHADFITSTTHKTLRGPRGGIILSSKEHEKKLNSHIFPGIQGGPLEHVIAAKAVAFHEALQPNFKEYQKQVIQNAKVMAETFQGQGVDIVSGGTDNHLVLIKTDSFNLSGKDCERILEEVNITTNKNMIPNDQRSPFVTSGVRIGTPAMTTRGMKESEAQHIAGWICETLKNSSDESMKAKIKGQVEELCMQFPVY